MSTQVKSTGWVARNYNGRGLIVHNFVTKNLLRTSGGVLWAALRENVQNKYLRIYRSVNGGYSWDIMWQGTFTQPAFRTQGLAGLNTNGPIMQLRLDERRNRMLLLVSCYNAANAKYQIEPYLFRLNETDFLERITTVGETSPAILTLIDNDMDELAFATSQNDDFIFITHTRLSKLKLMLARLDEPIVTENMPDGPGDSYFNIHDSVCDDTDRLHVAILEDRGVNRALVYNRYNRDSNAWSAASTIVEFTAEDTFDLNLLRAADGRLTLLWGQHLDNSAQVTPRFSFSTDDGVTWSEPVDISSASPSDFRDLATQQLATRLTALQTLEGDIYVTYVTAIDGVDTCHYKKLTWDTDHFDQGPEELVSSHSSGAKFFHPTSTNLVSGDDPDNIRIGYVIGQGNQPNQLDTIPTKIRQKTLLEGTEEDLDAYDEDEPAFNQLPVTFNLLGAPNENLDFYALGVIGSVTGKYVGAFNRIGTSMRLVRWEPDPNSYLDDKSAFYQVAEYSAQVLFDANNYEFPQVTGLESFKKYIERDTRKLYLPPTFHLARNYVLNNGEFLKRTVWTCLFDGNEYELSQVVPFFYDNQIAYYTANAYVIGPSNDPFARRVLPSET